MLTVNEAKSIGISACINKLGYEFCKEHADNATSGYSEEDGFVNCFVGINDKPVNEYDISKVTQLILTSGIKWQYSARCNVSIIDGTVEFTECRIPD
ncbi:MAG: hypothetical protein IKY23_11545 [Lachnospiraceae bacterium]|nr:hypothetical protein [Lachnospiraceae bacterium]